MTPPSDALNGGWFTSADSINCITSSLSASRCTRRLTEGRDVSASAGKLARISAAARKPVANPTRSRGVAMRWRIRLISRSISPAFFNASASLAWVNVSARSSLMTSWRACKASISRSGSPTQRRNNRPPIGLRVLSSIHSSDPFDEPLRPLSKSSRLRRVCASRVINSVTE